MKKKCLSVALKTFCDHSNNIVTVYLCLWNTRQKSGNAERRPVFAPLPTWNYIFLLLRMIWLDKKRVCAPAGRSNTGVSLWNMQLSELRAQEVIETPAWVMDMGPYSTVLSFNMYSSRISGWSYTTYPTTVIPRILLELYHISDYSYSTYPTHLFPHIVKKII